MKYLITCPKENMTALLCELHRSKEAFAKASKSPMFKPVQQAMSKAFGMSTAMPVMMIDYKPIDETKVDLDLSFISEGMVRQDIMINKLKGMLERYDATIEKVVEIKDETKHK